MQGRNTNHQFIQEVFDVLGENFFLSDMIWQEELFEKQEKLLKIICDYANNGLLSANRLAENMPKVFKTE